MTEWMELKAEDLDSSETQEINGIDVVLGLSPLDVPKKVRGEYNSDTERFVIKLQYLFNDEPMQTVECDEHSTLVVGKNSGCIYEVHLDVDAMDVEKVTLSIVTKASHSIDAFEKTMKRSEHRRRRLETTKKAVRALQEA